MEKNGKHNNGKNFEKGRCTRKKQVKKLQEPINHLLIKSPKQYPKY